MRAIYNLWIFIVAGLSAVGVLVYGWVWDLNQVGRPADLNRKDLHQGKLFYTGMARFLCALFLTGLLLDVWLFELEWNGHISATVALIVAMNVLALYFRYWDDAPDGLSLVREIRRLEPKAAMNATSGALGAIAGLGVIGALFIYMMYEGTMRAFALVNHLFS